MAETLEVTYRQLEAKLAQRVGAMYVNCLGHEPHQVSCQLAEKTVAIVIQGAITKPEQLLLKQGKHQLAKQVRYNIQTALQPQLQSLVEEILAVSVIDILSDSNSDTGSTSAIAVLGGVPSITDIAAAPTKPGLELERDGDE